jgi:hypothetical protein
VGAGILRLGRSRSASRNVLAGLCRRRLALDPAPNGDVVHGQVPLRNDLLQVAIRERISQVPANAHQDDHVFEMPPAEQYLTVFGSRYTLPDQLIRICNRTKKTPAIYSSKIAGTDSEEITE